MTPSWIPASISVVAALGAAMHTGDLREEIHPKVESAGLNAHETHASASLLGQFRTSVSSWLWLRTDLYLHNGVRMRPLTEDEIKRGVRGVGTSDNEDGGLHDDSKITTVIPAADQDFRGIFGDLERATKAYKDMRGHGHNDPQQALPLFRLMTWLDPSFIPGWVVGANVIGRKRTPEAYRKALDYLDQGLEQNPESIAILNEKGSIWLAKLHEYRRATPVFEQAIEAARGREFAKLSPDDQDALQWSYRWLVIAYRDLGKLDRQYQVAREGLQLFPEDVILNRTLATPPFVLKNRDDAAAAAIEKAKQEKEEEEEHDH